MPVSRPNTPPRAGFRRLSTLVRRAAGPYGPGAGGANRGRVAVGFALLAAVFATPPAVAAGDGAATATIERVRDRPLPERWDGRRVDEPVFGSRMYVVEAGPADGIPVLLVHGLGRSGYQDWWETIDALEDEYRVVALDLPGFARSTVPDGRLSPARYARLLDWLIRDLELDDIHLVGHSMGAAVALYYAGTMPDRVANVVAVDAAGILHRFAFLRAVAAARVQADYGLPDFVAEGVRGVFEWGAGVVEGILLSSGIDVVEVLRRSGSAWDALLDDRPNVNAAIALLETDFSRVLDGFDRPTTVIWGERDSVAPVRTGHMLHGILPDNRLRVIEEAAHIPMRSDTAAFLGHLRTALESPPAGTGRSGVPDDGAGGEFVCRGQAGGTVSGDFGRIVLDNCPGMRLVDVRADHITITRSGDVRLRHVTVGDGAAGADGPGISITAADVTATDLAVSGDPAVRVDGARLDIAGGRLRAPDAALDVARGSTVVFSVSHIRSARHTGFLHGAVEAAGTVLDAAPALHSKTARQESASLRP